MITIYGLTDEHGQIRYIGQTISPASRFRSHCDSREDFFPVGFAPLETQTTNADACNAERKWIEFFGLDNLCNTHGGSESINRKSPEGSISQIVVRLTDVQRGFLAELTGPHGSLSSVIRMLIDARMNMKPAVNMHGQINVVLPNLRQMIQMAKRKKG